MYRKIEPGLASGVGDGVRPPLGLLVLRLFWAILGVTFAPSKKPCSVNAFQVSVSPTVQPVDLNLLAFLTLRV